MKNIVIIIVGVSLFACSKENKKVSIEKDSIVVQKKIESDEYSDLPRPSDQQIFSEFNFIYDNFRSGINGVLDPAKINLSEEKLYEFGEENDTKDSVKLALKKYPGYFTTDSSMQWLVLIIPDNKEMLSGAHLWRDDYCILFLYTYSNHNEKWVLSYITNFYNDLEVIKIDENDNYNQIYVHNSGGSQGSYSWIQGFYKIDKSKGLEELYFGNSYSRTMYLESEMQKDGAPLGSYKVGDTLAIQYDNYEFTDLNKDGINELLWDEKISLFNEFKPKILVYTRKKIFKYKGDRFVFESATPFVKEE